MESTHTDYNASIKGIFGRNRSVKYEGRTLARVTAGDAADVPTLLDAARAYAAEKKLRPGGRIVLTSRAVRVERHDDGDPAWTSVTFAPFDDVTLAVETV